MPQQFKSGPSGGRGGDDFQDNFSSEGLKIKRIDIWHGNRIDAIQIYWSNGTHSNKHGGGGGTQTKIELDNDEYLVGIQGRYGATVDSISLTTTKRSLGKYGGDGGNVSFDYNTSPQMPKIEIIAFFGRSGDKIDAIGCIFSQYT